MAARPRKAHVDHAPRTAPRETAPASAGGRAYPDLRELGGGSSVLAHARKLAQVLFAAGAAAGLAGAAGCAPPECQATRVDEVRVHGGEALQELTDLRVRDATEQLGVGLGVVPHPVSAPLPGAMPPVYVPPVPVAPDGGADEDAGTGTAR